MALYLLGTENGEFGMKLASEDPDATVVLIQDATFLALNGLEKFHDTTRVTALYEDADQRGLIGRLPETIRLIQYEELLELVIQENVVCFP
jgi:sulfur relay protein TusB/DsrH